MFHKPLQNRSISKKRWFGVDKAEDINCNFATILLPTGAVAIPATAGGQLLGGFISSKYKLKVRGLIRGLIRLSLVTVIALLSTPVMMARCTPANSAGINSYYGNRWVSFSSLSVMRITAIRRHWGPVIPIGQNWKPGTGRFPYSFQILRE
jgi:hypothetical protein